MILFFDTETTGMWLKNLDPSDAQQPGMVELGLLVTDDEGREVCALNLIVDSGKVCSKEAQAVHGIYPDVIKKYGVTAKAATTIFAQLLNKCDLYVAHNLWFDKNIMLHQFLLDSAMEVEIEMLEKPSFCTMLGSMPLCKIPGFRGEYKWPKLTEACLKLLGYPHDSAHTALGDVRVCKELYFYIKGLENAKR